MYCLDKRACINSAIAVAFLIGKQNAGMRVVRSCIRHGGLFEE